MRPPQDWKRARVTLAIAGVTALAWLLDFASGRADLVAIWGGFIPARLGGAVATFPLAPLVVTPLTATLVHAGFIHLFFNLMMLLICGRPVENVLGGKALAILYLVGAYAAAASHYAVGPHESAPMVGASGAISAVLGAYAMLFGRNRVKIANSTLGMVVNALWLVAAWVGLQILVGFTFQTIGARLAVAAHIGGFIAGLALARPLLMLRWRGA